ncbi:hypothetical protein F4561_000253 [Lipingzhangella halophila]|uniref:Uncharacterized protein n=1 Tax=Lipingzhangella halophila TaxID=1783352 RepID=A0A7W7RCF8_9ACTN|nr:hypothetical protein [Lipingzhangella halophila]MBB4929433.1 hypothetical protein [Lipingzhangella halophila]
MSIDLPRFLASWYGLSDAPPKPLSGNYSWLPEALKEWYELSSQWTAPIMTMKRMHAPEEIAVECGKAIFMTGSGDEVWAFDPDSTLDVYEGQIYGEWEQVAELFPEFLVHNALNEAAYNAISRISCDDVEENQLEEILAPMEEVGFGGWRWPRPGHRVFMSKELVADVGPAIEDQEPWEGRAGHFEVQIGSNNPMLTAYFDQIRGINWFRSGQANLQR